MINEGDTMDTNMTPVTTTAASPPSQQQQQHYSPWHSPVPYLFGGLAAMLGLIAFALLVLACSYWKLSSHLEDGEGNDDHQDIEGGNLKQPSSQLPQYEEKILVIMAGQVKPTCLATPSSSRSSSFGDRNCKVNGNDRKNETVGMKNGEDGGGVQLVQQVHEDDGRNNHNNTNNHHM